MKFNGVNRIKGLDFNWMDKQEVGKSVTCTFAFQL